VFPDAALKVYLTASPEVRAERRSKEVSDLSYETVAADLARRDALDQGRDASPLELADDAVLVDTTDRSIDEIVDAISSGEYETDQATLEVWLAGARMFRDIIQGTGNRAQMLSAAVRYLEDAEAAGFGGLGISSASRADA
jgi:hypothetical protein